MRRGVSLLAMVVLVAGCSTGKDAVVQGSDYEFVAPGGQTKIFYDGATRKPLPNITGDDLIHPGKQIGVADFPGDVVVLNIWGSWCPPCRNEAVELQKINQQWQARGVRVLGVDVKESGRSGGQDFLRDRNIGYPSIFDLSGRSLLPLKNYPKSTIPSTIVLDRQHRVAAVYLQSLLTTDLAPELQKLTAEPDTR